MWRSVFALLLLATAGVLDVDGARLATQQTRTYGNGASEPEPQPEEAAEAEAAEEKEADPADDGEVAEAEGAEEEEDEEATTTTTTTEGPASSGWEIRKRIAKLKEVNNVSEAGDFEVTSARLEELPEFKSAKCVRVNPHWRELHVRLAVLKAGKLLVVPQAGLRGLSVLDPTKIDPEQYADAVTEAGVKKFGAPADFKHLAIDLFVVGSMAVNPESGCRLGPFGGLDELEYEVLRQLKAIPEDAPIVTAVHELELRDDIPSDYISCFDLPADIVITSKSTIRTDSSIPKPVGLNVTKIAQKPGFIGLLWSVKAQLEKSLGAQLTLAEEEFIVTAPEPTTTTAVPLYEDDDWTTSAWRIRGHILKQMEVASVNETLDFERASKHLVKLPEFKNAKVVRVHPHWRDYHTRLAALRAGKTLVVPQAGFRDISVLDPSKISKKAYREAVTEVGLKKFGVPIAEYGEQIRIDLFVVTSMAVNPAKGCRLGTHGGFEELEYQLLRQLKAIDKKVPVVTSVHDLEIVTEIPSANVPCEILPVDIVCTPTLTIRPSAIPRKPTGLIVKKLVPKQLGSSDIIKRLRPQLEKELGKKLPIPEEEQLLPGMQEGYGSKKRSGKGGQKKAVVPVVRSGKGGRQQEEVVPEPVARSGKGGRQQAEAVEATAPVARSGKGGRQQAEGVEKPAPVARSGKGGRQQAEVVPEPAPVTRSGKGGRQQAEVEVAKPAPAPVTRSGKGGRQQAEVEIAKPAPAARSGKGGRQQSEVAQEPVARSGKGGRQQATVEAEPEPVARSGKGGRKIEETPAPAVRSGKGGRAVVEEPAPAPAPRRSRRGGRGHLEVIEVSEPTPAARSGKGGRQQTQAAEVAEPAPVARSGKGGRQQEAAQTAKGAAPAAVAPQRQRRRPLRRRQ